MSTFDVAKEPWFFSTVHDWPFRSTLIAYLVMVVVGTAWFLLLKHKAKDVESADYVQKLVTAATFMLWLMFEFSIMSARFHYFLNHDFHPVP